MVKVIFVKNPFSPARDRVVKLSEATDKPLNFYTDDFVQQLPNQEAWIQIDGRKVNAVVEDISKLPVKAGSIIVVMPKVAKGGKSFLGLIAVIALSVVSMGVGGYMATGTWGSFAGASAWTAAANYMAAAAIMFLGSSLVSRFFTPKIDTGKYSSEDPTYSWNGVQTMDGQGNGISITYGKVKSGGQSIMKFTSNNGNDQYFNWLVAAGAGELKISDIKLNSNPVGNYEDVLLEIRPGSNEQEVIANFNDTVLSKGLGYELSEDKWRTDEIQGNSTEGIIIELECSNGLYHANDNGSLSTAWVDIEAQYALSGTDNWTAFVQKDKMITINKLGATLADAKKAVGKYYVAVSRTVNDLVRLRVSDKSGLADDSFLYSAEAEFEPTASGNVTVFGINFQKAKISQVAQGTYCIEVIAAGENRISGAKAGAVRKRWRVDDLAPGKYQVRLKVVARSASVDSSRDGVRIWWTQLNSVIYDDFAYPGIALLGIKAKATEQLSGGTPQLSFIKERAHVYIWNPLAKAYEKRPADNPAWAAYDFLHGAERLKDINSGEYVYDYQGIPKELLLYDQFKAWADNCDKMNLKINLEISSLKDFWTIINQDIAPVGRGMVVQFGTKYGCIYDHKTQPVQLFNMGNIIQGSFSQAYMSTEERADSVELTYIDADKDYEKTTLTIYADDYDVLDIPNQPTQIAMDGITSYEQAYREGKYQLYCNRLLKETVTFKADVESIGCMVGDVVLIAHDVPQWGISGRVTDCKNGYVVLPIDLDELDLAGNQYGLMIRNSADNTLTTYNVLSAEGSYGNVKVIANGIIKANQGDLFSLGKIASVAKPFTITSISRTKDLEYTLSAIEYAEGVFDENYDIPDQEPSLSTTLADVVNLEARQIAYKGPEGQAKSRMFLSWDLPEKAEAESYTVYLSSDRGTTWENITNTTSMQAEIDTQAYVSYYVKVVARKGLKRSLGAVIGPIAPGDDALPPDVKSLDTEVLHNGMRRYYWDFTYPEPNDIAGFRLKYTQGTVPNWEMGYSVQDGLVTAQPYETATIRQGAHTVMIKAVDNAGQESDNFAHCTVNLGDPLEDNVLLKIDLSENNWNAVVTDGNIFSDGFIHSKQSGTHYSAQDAPYWEKPQANFWNNEGFKNFTVEATINCPAAGNFYLLYEIDGAADITYCVNGRDSIYKPYATKFRVSAGDVINVRFKTPGGASETVLKKLIAVIDVPDREEHFENLKVPEAGLTLPIKTPHYATTAVHIDSIRGDVAQQGVYMPEIVSRTPCLIKIYKLELVDGNWQQSYVDAIVDITWQGYSDERM